MMANCHRWSARELPKDTGPAFRLNRVLDDGSKQSLALVQVQPGDNQLFRVDPLLPTGLQTVEVVPEPECTKKENDQCDGFYAVITM
jgi:hypothetical protein